MFICEYILSSESYNGVLPKYAGRGSLIASAEAAHLDLAPNKKYGFVMNEPLFTYL